MFVVPFYDWIAHWHSRLPIVVGSELVHNFIDDRAEHVDYHAVLTD